MVQLPGLNTPQFDWCRSKMPGRAQPIGAVFQPEVAARAIEYAATHRRRELTVGWPALEAIYGNKLAPGYADRKLARIGFAGQQSVEPEDAERPDNLFEPVAGDHGAHGRFDDRAHGASLELAANLHRSVLLGAGVVALGAAALLVPRLWRA